MVHKSGCALLFMAFLAGTAKADISIDKLQGQGYTDMGELVKGNAGGVPVEDIYLNRLGANLTVSDTMGRLSLRITVGGIFWNSFPEGDFWQNFIKFGPGINEASTKLRFGSTYAVEGGYFPFKYDSPAMNLGEYLLRSESYPTYITTGGWQWVDSAYTRVLGARIAGSHFGGAFRHQLGLYLEFENAPLWDITPAYVFAWRPAKGLELGGGIALRRWITNNRAYFGNKAEARSALTATRYVTVANFPEVQNQARVHYTYTDGSGQLASADTFAVWRGGAALDQSALLGGKTGAQVTKVDMVQDGSPAGARSGIQRFLMNTKWSDGSDCYDGQTQTCVSYYDTSGMVVQTDANGNVVSDQASRQAAQVTHSEELTRAAVNVMGRVELDIGEMLGVSAATGPFKLYSEIALLGVKNQPVYYENRLQRMPVMVGLHVPTFGLLDLLAVETEYLSNPYQDSQQELSINLNESLVGPSMPLPDLPQGAYDAPRFQPTAIHGDDWKWSVHAVRTLTPGLKAKVQVANDHMRLKNFDVAGILPSSYPQTAMKSEWYYMAHLEWAL